MRAVPSPPPVLCLQYVKIFQIFNIFNTLSRVIRNQTQQEEEFHRGTRAMETVSGKAKHSDILESSRRTRLQAGGTQCQLAAVLTPKAGDFTAN